MNNSVSVEKLVKQLDSKDINFIVKFGTSFGQTISYNIDMFFQCISNLSKDDLKNIIDDLNRLINEVDINDFLKKKNNLFYRLINTGVNEQKELLKKYSQIETEIDKIYVRLRQYNLELKTLNNKLKDIYNIFEVELKELETYIRAGESVAHKWGKEESYINKDNDKIAFETLEERIHHLKAIKNVVYQVIYQIKSTENMNNELIERVNTNLLNNMIPLKEYLKEILVAIKISQDNLIEIKQLESLKRNLFQGIQDTNNIENKIKSIMKNSTE